MIVNAMKVHGGEDVNKEHDDNVSMVWSEGGGGSIKDRHVWRSVGLMEKRDGRKGKPDLVLTFGADVHHATSSGEEEECMGV